MGDYKYICNNTGCPAIIATPIRFKSNEKQKCPFCGHMVVENTPNVNFEEKTFVAEIEDGEVKVLSRTESED